MICLHVNNVCHVYVFSLIKMSFLSRDLEHDIVLSALTTQMLAKIGFCRL